MLLTISDVLSLVPVSRAQLYILMDRGDFPKPIKVGKRVLWDIREIEAWRDEHLEARDE